MTLDAEVPVQSLGSAWLRVGCLRVGVHLGKKGEKYVSSPNLDRTASRYLPQSPHMQQKRRPQQIEKLAELIQLSEPSHQSCTF